MNISIDVDRINYGKLWKSLHGEKGTDNKRQGLNGDKVHGVAIGDTEATVCCTSPAVMRSLGLAQERLLPTNLTLVVMVRDLMYVVEELKHTYISRDALEGLGSVNKYFPLPPPRRFQGKVMSIRGTSSAMVEDKPCIQSDNRVGPKA